MNCSTCQNKIEYKGKRQRHAFLFCSTKCAKNDTLLKKCNVCGELRSAYWFEVKKSRGYYYLGVRCSECRKEAVNKIIITFMDLRESLVHTDVTSVRYEANCLIINSIKDKKEYSYPLSNIRKIEKILSSKALKSKYESSNSQYDSD